MSGVSGERPAGSRAEGSQQADLASVVEDLCNRCNGGDGSVLRGGRRQALPSRDIIAATVEELRSVLFPGYFGASELSAESMRFYVGSALDRVLRTLREQVRRGLCFACDQDNPELCAECEGKSRSIVGEFLKRLPGIQQILATDAAAAYEGDPAATSPDEAVFCYPGLMAITNYRLAHELYLLNVPVIPRIITEQAHSTTGVDIHPGAAIGQSFFIDHGTGVVIGETCEIGDRVRLYQGVTLGAKSFPLDKNGAPIKGVPRHPIVEDDVIIYSGATILGRVRIGRGAVVGGNVWLTRSVPAGAVISQADLLQDSFDNGGGI